jgi:hypothetical protein
MGRTIVTSARAYWKDNQSRYPFQTTAPINDPSPHDFDAAHILFSDFIVCPFDGVAYWGFEHAADLEMFLARKKP